MADALPLPNSSQNAGEFSRVPLSFDGQEWHFHHERELPRTIELVAALMAGDEGEEPGKAG